MRLSSLLSPLLAAAMLGGCAETSASPPSAPSTGTHQRPLLDGNVVQVRDSYPGLSSATPGDPKGFVSSGGKLFFSAKALDEGASL